ncbi:WASH complex subunit 3 [Plodia interpunctella]|uniref:WASH complex subunit 3 n=1 Tax=Plodia interpunctella TaxID=58824 RepID=UPI002368DE60|nr:WASH complex subunit 3 [Plodia interpunctella]
MSKLKENYKSPNLYLLVFVCFEIITSECSIKYYQNNMHDNIANDEFSKVDLTKVAALQQKRTLAFVNHFVTTTVQFLNNFMKRCDHKLMNFEKKLEKVEASMVLLEARLSSIPEINTTQAKAQEQPTDDTANTEVANTQSNKTSVDNTDEEKSKDVPATVTIPPEYEKFIKMVQVGVPLQAVKLKAGIEGLNTDLLEKILNK